MPTKSSNPTPKRTPTKSGSGRSPASSSSKSTPKRSRSVSSRQLALHTIKQRTSFVAAAVLLAAALLAISIGMTGYNRSDTSRQTGSSAAVQTANNQASLTLKPLDHKELAPGTVIEVGMYENSLTDPVNAVQGAIKYPADKLRVVRVTTGDTFPQEAATDTASSGLVRFARSIAPQAAPVMGEKLVVTIEFEVLKTVDVASELIVDKQASYLVRSTDNQNILGNSTSSLNLRR